jgi:hypothetical protein
VQLQREPGNNAKGGGSGVVINCVRELRSVSSKGRRRLHHVGSEEMLFLGGGTAKIVAMNKGCVFSNWNAQLQCNDS